MVLLHLFTLLAPWRVQGLPQQKNTHGFESLSAVALPSFGSVSRIKLVE
jgi:hypothetical protein